MNHFYHLALAGVFALNAFAANAQSDEWIEVNIETPGSLGVEILYKADKLSDVTHLKIAGSLNSNDWSTIKNLSAIQEIDLSQTDSREIPANTFQSRGSLKSIKLPETLTNIGNYAFTGSGIQNITITKNVTNIGDYAFQDTKSLAQVSFESDSALKTIGHSAFYSSTLTTFDFPENLTTIGNYAFYGCTKLESAILPEGLKNINQRAFYQTTGLKSVTFPESLTAIDYSAFQESGLIEAILPDNVTLGNEVFRNCSSLQRLRLPATLTAIPSGCFRYCSSITEFYVPSLIPPTLGSTALDGISKGNVTLHVPEFAVANFKLDSNWLDFAKIVGDTESDSYSFRGNVAFTNNHRAEGTPSLTLVDGGSMTISGSAPMLINNLTIHNNTYNNPGYCGQFINSSPLMTANSVTTTFYFYEKRWFFITLPYDVKFSEITSSNASAAWVARYYDGTKRASSGTGASWTDYKQDDIIKAGTGFIFQSSATATYYFPATKESHENFFTPNAITRVLDANPSENSANAGWNYVGNPFPSYYDLYYTMLSCPITVWNSNYSRYDAYSLVDDNVVLQPWQPFFIQASDDIKEIEFGTKGRQFSSSVSRAASRRIAGISGRLVFNLTLSSGEFSDNTRIVLNQEASADYEPSRDAAKFFGADENIPVLYSIDESANALAINERPASDIPVRLGFYAPQAGIMRLSLSNSNESVIITDNLTGKQHNLSAGESYEFNVEEPGYSENRLAVMLNSNISTGVSENLTSNASANLIVDGNRVSIDAAGRLTVYTVDGRIVADMNAPEDGATITLPSGIYLISVDGETTKCIIK